MKESRPIVDIDAVATGEAWYGRRALEHKLVDAVQTSDEYLIDRCELADVYRVKYVEDKNRMDKVLDRFSGMLKSLLRLKVKPADLEYQGPFRF